MTPAKRIIVNTTAQYIRTILNILLSLYSTRLLLNILGVEDYGVYSLIAGVVAMIAFLNNALVVTTQRYLSFYQGRNDLQKVKEIFSNSLIIHIILGIIVSLVIEILGIFLFDGFFNIQEDRIVAAKALYHFVTIMLFITFITAPFRALFLSRENIIYSSIVDVIYSILKVIIAFVLFITADKLIGYGAFMVGASLFNFFAFSIYGLKKFEECVLPKWRDFNKQYVRELSYFAGWTIYSTGCVVGRTQGVVILLNKVFGVVVNASYGIAIQVSSSITILSQSLLNAINPQIMKAEGASDRQRMLRLSEIASKFSLLILAMFAIPCIFEMPILLKLWLKDVPEYAIFFCRMILVTSLCDQLTIGLGSANQAIGNIKIYSLIVYTIKLLTLPAAWIFLRFGYNLYWVMCCYIFFELVSSLIRLPIIKRTSGILIWSFTKNVFLQEIIPVIILLVSCWIITANLYMQYRFIITFVIPIIFYSIAIYYFGLCLDEKNLLKQVTSNVISKLRYK